MTLEQQQRALEKARSRKLAHHPGVNVAGPCDQLAAAPAPTTTVHQRHGDRGSDDDNDSRRDCPSTCVLPTSLLPGIAGSWTQLLRIIDYEGFRPANCSARTSAPGAPTRSRNGSPAARPTAGKSLKATAGLSPQRSATAAAPPNTRALPLSTRKPPPLARARFAFLKATRRCEAVVVAHDAPRSSRSLQRDFPFSTPRPCRRAARR